MKNIARNTLRCFVAAFVVIASAARAETTAELANRSNCIVGFDITGPAAVSYHTTLVIGGQPTHSSSQTHVPYGNDRGGVSYVTFGTQLTITTELVQEDQTPRVAVTLDFENAIPVGKGLPQAASPARAFKIRACAKLPITGGDITLEQKDIEVLRREGLDATPFKLRLLMKLAPVGKR